MAAGSGSRLVVHASTGFPPALWLVRRGRFPLRNVPNRKDGVERSAMPLETKFWRRVEGRMYRLDETECTMRCAFCPTSVWLPRLGAASTEEQADDVLAEVKQIPEETPAEEYLRLTADDLMTFDGSYEIPDVFPRHQRRFELDTPGLRLADPAFAKAVSRYDVHLTVSCQAASTEGTKP